MPPIDLGLHDAKRFIPSIREDLVNFSLHLRFGDASPAQALLEILLWACLHMMPEKVSGRRD
jgi:hypothetical protein